MTHRPTFHLSLVFYTAASLGLVACAKDTEAEHPPLSAVDENEEAMKESEEVAKERQTESALEATDGVENADVIEDEAGRLEADDVDAEEEPQ